MSCFFCESLFHTSQNCDINVVDESRRNFAKTKSCCPNCLTVIKFTNQCTFTPISAPFVKGVGCNQKCYICFSKNHHTVYCPERLTVSSSTKFLPNIDKNLISRYINCLNLEEQYSLAFSLPEVFNTIKIKPLKIKDSFVNGYREEKFDDRNFVITHFVDLKKLSLSQSNFGNIIFKVRTVILKNLTSLPPQIFLQFLSSATEELICTNVNFVSEIEFSEIIKRLSNLKKIEIKKSNNIKIRESWPQEMLKWKHGNDFESFNVLINDIDFDIKALADFMKKKSTIYAQYILTIDPSTLDTSIYEQKCLALFKNLKEHFYEKNHEINELPTLTIKTSRKVVHYNCL